MPNIFKDEKTLGDHLVAFYRSHAGQPIERFLRFILPKYLLENMPQPEEQEEEEKPKKKGKAK